MPDQTPLPLPPFAHLTPHINEPAAAATTMITTVTSHSLPATAKATVTPDPPTFPSTQPATTTVSSDVGPPPRTRPPTAFISGHITISPPEFRTHYIPQLAHALTYNSPPHAFILGDAPGVDTLALAYLLEHGPSGIEKRITVMPSRGYNIPKLEALGVVVGEIVRVGNGGAVMGADGKVKESGRGRGRGRGRGKGGGSSRAHHLARDARCTAESDYDILWVRGREEEKELFGAGWRERVSGTEMNRLRRGEKDRSGEMQEGGV